MHRFKTPTSEDFSHVGMSEAASALPLRHRSMITIKWKRCMWEPWAYCAGEDDNIQEGRMKGKSPHAHCAAACDAESRALVNLHDYRAQYLPAQFTQGFRNIHYIPKQSTQCAESYAKDFLSPLIMVFILSTMCYLNTSHGRHLQPRSTAQQMVASWLPQKQEWSIISSFPW